MQVKFHPRAELGIGVPVFGRISLRSTVDAGVGHEGLTHHWTGDGGTLFHPDPIVRLRGIWNYHVHTLGYGDIAYLGAYDADGNTFGLREPRYVQAHAESTNNEANRRTDGIVFLEDKRGWTDAALHAWVWWFDVYRLVHGRKPELFSHRYWGHHGGKPTFCPGNQVDAVVRFCGGHT